MKTIFSVTLLIALGLAASCDFARADFALGQVDRSEFELAENDYGNGGDEFLVRVATGCSWGLTLAKATEAQRLASCSEGPANIVEICRDGSNVRYRLECPLPYKSSGR